ncbi:hypothetical protein DFP94_11263 [Fontibacillus phaseoli]|uniref:Uncharacterized protein n=1 Tax=Fontibacillus phaseoli TaxID=1416533 RepID=A0A369B4N3_9BACL|nr:hypothetical protein DFP94_11263 [Fontibacillus phaseoli]
MKVDAAFGIKTGGRGYKAYKSTASSLEYSNEVSTVAQIAAASLEISNEARLFKAKGPIRALFTWIFPI